MIGDINGQRYLQLLGIGMQSTEPGKPFVSLSSLAPIWTHYLTCNSLLKHYFPWSFEATAVWIFCIKKKKSVPSYDDTLRNYTYSRFRAKVTINYARLHGTLLRRQKLMSVKQCPKKAPMHTTMPTQKRALPVTVLEVMKSATVPNNPPNKATYN